MKKQRPEVPKLESMFKSSKAKTYPENIANEDVTQYSKGGQIPEIIIAKERMTVYVPQNVFDLIEDTVTILRREYRIRPNRSMVVEYLLARELRSPVAVAKLIYEQVNK